MTETSSITSTPVRTSPQIVKTPEAYLNVLHAAAGRFRDLANTVHDVSSAASRRLLDMAKARVAARAGVIDILADDPQPAVAEQQATMAEVSAHLVVARRCDREQPPAVTDVLLCRGSMLSTATPSSCRRGHTCPQSEPLTGDAYAPIDVCPSSP